MYRLRLVLIAQPEEAYWSSYLIRIFCIIAKSTIFRIIYTGWELIENKKAPENNSEAYNFTSLADKVLACQTGGSYHTSTTNRITSFLQGVHQRTRNSPGKISGAAQLNLFYYKYRHI